MTKANYAIKWLLFAAVIFMETMAVTAVSLKS